MDQLQTPAQVQDWCAARLQAGETVALVPTMGALHEGHLALIEEARKHAPRVAVTLFVNPKQFGAQEDLSRYPRDLEGDRRKVAEAGAHLLFAPSPADVYPPGYQTYVEVESVTRGLEGAARPGHFRGVATIVTQLFTLFRPAFAVFGEKDYQQLQTIRALNRDLHLRVNVVGIPTVREADGLAKSSRNAYLTPEDRRRAPALYQGLQAAQALYRAGERGGGRLTGAVRQALSAAGIREDYVALVDAESLEPIERGEPGRPARLLVAGFLGKTRLIDNVGL